MTDQVEIERKYDADSDFTVPDLSDLPGVHAVSDPQTRVLTARYFDTPDFRLAACGITLRRRRGGDDAGWHLKVPAGPDTKSELHAPLGSAKAVPTRLSNLIAAHTRGEPLRPVADLQTNRTIVRLLGADGEILAEVADDAVTGQVLDHAADTNGSHPADRDEYDDTAHSAWREVEVELTGGSRDLLKATGRRLRKAGARKAHSTSKLVRLLGDAVPERPTRRLTWTTGTAGDAVMAYLTEQVDTLLSHDPKARLAEYDAVHRMRVSVRRIRSTMKGFRAILDRKHTDVLLPELKWLGEELGMVRDLEVLRERFTGRLDALPADLAGHRGWLDTLVAREKAAYLRLNATLKEPRYFALLDALDQLVCDPPLTERGGRQAAKELPGPVLRSWRRLERAYNAIETVPEGERDTARHETRKVAKRARYSAEAAKKALGEPAATIAANAKSMQEVLGRFQDGVIAQEHLTHIAATATDPRETFTLGVLYEVERQEAQTALDSVAATWAKASDLKALGALRD